MMLYELDPIERAAAEPSPPDRYRVELRLDSSPPRTYVLGIINDNSVVNSFAMPPIPENVAYTIVYVPLI